MVELFGVRANPIFATALSLFGREFVTVRDGVDQNSVIAVVERVPSGAVNAPSRGGSSPRRANPPDGRAAAQFPNCFSDHALRRLFGLGNSIEARRSPEVVCTRREIAWCRVKRCCICRRARVASFDGFRASDQKSRPAAVRRRDLCGKDGNHADASIASQSRNRHLLHRHSKI
jgi:hypothetical protein